MITSHFGYIWEMPKKFLKIGIDILIKIYKEKTIFLKDVIYKSLGEIITTSRY